MTRSSLAVVAKFLIWLVILGDRNDTVSTSTCFHLIISSLHLSCLRQQSLSQFDSKQFWLEITSCLVPRILSCVGNVGCLVVFA